MKDMKEWHCMEQWRYVDQGEEYIDHCIERLFNDREHRLLEELVPGLTYEELLVGLAIGKKAIRNYENR